MTSLLRVFRSIGVGCALLLLTLGAASAQTVSVNGTTCGSGNPASVKFSAGKIEILTEGCGQSTAPTAPQITSAAPPTTGNVGAAYSHQFQATGSQPITWSLGSGAFPTGVTINSSTGLLSGPPTTAGSFTFTVVASNGTLPNASSGPHNVTISDAPVFTNTVPTTAIINQPFSHTVNASGNPAPTLSVSAGLPTWLTFNTSTRVLSGTPDALGTSTFTITAMNTSGTVTQNVSLTVNAAGTAPTITSGNPPAGVVGTVYPTFSFVAGGSPAASWSSSSTIPGLTLNTTTGALSGTPTTAGTYSYSITASNGTLPNATATYSIVITSNSSALTDINGNVIPSPISKVAKVTPPSHAAPNGANQNAWAVSPTRCTGKTTPAITTYWHHNIDFADHATKVTNDYIAFAPNEALTYQFTASASNLGIGLISLSQGQGTVVPAFLSITTAPCDFDIPKANVNACYSSGNGDTGFYYEVTNSASAFGCKLTPGTTYYINVRWQNAATSATNPVDSCAAVGAFECGGLLGIRKI